MEYKLIYINGTEEITEIYYSEEDYITALELLQKKINVTNSTFNWIESISGSNA